MRSFRVAFSLLFLALFSGQVIGPSSAAKKSQPEKKTKAEKENDLLDFNSIKDILKEDQLQKQAQKKKSKGDKLRKKRIKRNVTRYNLPKEDDIWSFLSEYWIVKNASVLKWEFQKPDYGLDLYLNGVLRALGLYQKEFKILLLNTPALAHAALPASSGEYIVLISVPFIQVMDLTKLEISILVLESFYRSDLRIVVKKVRDPELSKILGKNFYGKELKLDAFKKTLSNYDKVFFNKGFTFQEQFEITKKMKLILKGHPKYWNAYLSLLKKINTLIRTNALYSKYNEIYPSPEQQIRWLIPGVPLGGLD
jgi:hypothetical protein